MKTSQPAPWSPMRQGVLDEAQFIYFGQWHGERSSGDRGFDQIFSRKILDQSKTICDTFASTKHFSLKRLPIGAFSLLRRAFPVNNLTLFTSGKAQPNCFIKLEQSLTLTSCRLKFESI